MPASACFTVGARSMQLRTCRPSPRAGRRSSQRPGSYPGRPRHRRWWVRPTRRPVRQRTAKSRSARAAIMTSATRSHAPPTPCARRGAGAPIGRRAIGRPRVARPPSVVAADAEPEMKEEIDTRVRGATGGRPNMRTPASILSTVSQSQATPTSAGHTRAAILVPGSAAAGRIHNLVRRAGVRGVSRPRWMLSRSPVALPGPPPAFWRPRAGGRRWCC